MRLLDRLRSNREILKGEVRTSEVDLGLSPRLSNDLKSLGSDGARVGKLYAISVQFAWSVTSPDTDLWAATPEVVDECQFLRDAQRVMEREHDNAGTQTYGRR